MYIRLRGRVVTDVDGVSRQYYPGDWLEVGRQTATRWIAEGLAESLAGPLPIGDDVAILAPADRVDLVVGRLGSWGLTVPVVAGGLTTPGPWPAPRSIVWDGSASVRPDLLAVGADQVATWEIALPLISLEGLAEDLSDEGTGAEDKAAALAVVHDLRVPLYDDRLVFVRASAAADRFRAALIDASATIRTPALALLVALYQAQALLLPLPPAWVTARPGRTGRPGRP